MIRQSTVEEFQPPMGTDLTVVNAARVSFDKESSEFRANDKGLLVYLANHGHWSPFAHCFLSFRIETPIAVARQLTKHQVGLAWNEVSRRYVDSEPRYFMPDIWRAKAPNKKQGSLETGAADQDDWNRRYTQVCMANHALYLDMIAGGVAPEQARFVLPQGATTTWIWSGSLYAFSRIFSLRTASDAQKETAQVAEGIGRYAQKHFPVSWKALVEAKWPSDE